MGGTTYLQYWGKAKDGEEYHLLPYHSLDVAACAWALATADANLRYRLSKSMMVKQEAVPSLVATLLAFHDVGKFSDGFQNLRPDLLSHLQARSSEAAYPVRHDTLGFLALV